jgi:hypothetical protein
MPRPRSRVGTSSRSSSPRGTTVHRRHRLRQSNVAPLRTGLRFRTRSSPRPNSHRRLLRRRWRTGRPPIRRYSTCGDDRLPPRSIRSNRKLRRRKPRFRSGTSTSNHRRRRYFHRHIVRSGRADGRRHRSPASPTSSISPPVGPARRSPTLVHCRRLCSPPYHRPE